jgi:hypothetical protein
MATGQRYSNKGLGGLDLNLMGATKGTSSIVNAYSGTNVALTLVRARDPYGNVVNIKFWYTRR